jgi:hypothetical protein
VQRVCERIAVPNVKFIIVNIMQKHINTAKVIGRDVDFLTEEALPDVVFA